MPYMRPLIPLWLTLFALGACSNSGTGTGTPLPQNDGSVQADVHGADVVLDTAVADGGPVDAGQSDAGPVDVSGSQDVSQADSGAKDAGSQDAGSQDAGPQDAGPKDAGPKDAGPQDAGPQDANAKDVGSADAGTTDTITPDAGPVDAGNKPDSGPADAASKPDSGPSKPPPCCKNTVECGAGWMCTGGVCKALKDIPAGKCWSAENCAKGDLCKGPNICPCGALCIVPDKFGECTHPVGGCQKIDPNGYGMCEMILGIGWDGAKCTYVSGCSCGADCDKLFKTMEACKAACSAP